MATWSEVDALRMKLMDLESEMQGYIVYPENARRDPVKHYRLTLELNRATEKYHDQLHHMLRNAVHIPPTEWAR